MRARKRYFLQQFSDHVFFHGGVGCIDAERILADKGFQPILFPARNDFSFFAKWKRFLYLLRIFFFIDRSAVVVFLFPAYAKMEKLLLYLLGFRKNLSLVCFIADINGLKDGDEMLLKKEIQELRRYKYFIVHGDPMKKWLQEVVPDGRIGEIEFFDFLAEPYRGSREMSSNILFAGNLEKSPFLEQLFRLQDNSPGLRFHLYGSGQTDKMLSQQNVSWHGARSPYKLPLVLEGAFGLVWDGDAIDKPGGSLGEYMKYISHHKLSLYILSGLPVIVPAWGAAAGLVEKYRIGFTINNLYDIPGKLKQVSEEEYQQMRKNMVPLAKKISTGGCLEEALEILGVKF